MSIVERLTLKPEMHFCYGIVLTSQDKVRYGELCERRKYALRFSKNNVAKAAVDSITKTFVNKYTQDFWRKIKNANSDSNTVLADTVNDASGQHNITEMWHEYCKSC